YIIANPQTFGSIRRESSKAVVSNFITARVHTAKACARMALNIGKVIVMRKDRVSTRIDIHACAETGMIQEILGDSALILQVRMIYNRPHFPKRQQHPMTVFGN